LPSRSTHNVFVEMLGIPHDIADAVNKDIDEPAKELGPGHRRVRHDADYALNLAARMGDWRAMAAAGWHYQLDQLTQDPFTRRWIRILEAMRE
jgi:hypothetical protein